MDLSSRDKRILAEIECGSALEDPKWVRRFERVARRGESNPPVVRRAAISVLLLAWTAAVVLGATVWPRPVLWAALGLGLLGLAQIALWRRRSRGPFAGRRRRIPRIPRQNGHPADG
jgi:hypothetical protein